MAGFIFGSITVFVFSMVFHNAMGTVRGFVISTVSKLRGKK